MPSVAQNTAGAFSQLLGAVGSLGDTVTKSLMMLDRVTDAGYSHADTFAINTQLRNTGSIKDTELDEEERDLEREIRRLKFKANLEAFIESQKVKSQPSKAKPTKTKSS